MNTFSIGSHSYLSAFLAPTHIGPGTRPVGDRPDQSPRRQRPEHQAAAVRFSPVEDRVSSGLSLD